MQGVGGQQFRHGFAQHAFARARFPHQQNKTALASRHLNDMHGVRLTNHLRQAQGRHGNVGGGLPLGGVAGGADTQGGVAVVAGERQQRLFPRLLGGMRGAQCRGEQALGNGERGRRGRVEQGDHGMQNGLPLPRGWRGGQGRFHAAPPPSRQGAGAFFTHKTLAVVRQAPQHRPLISRRGGRVRQPPRGNPSHRPMGRVRQNRHGVGCEKAFQPGQRRPQGGGGRMAKKRQQHRPAPHVKHAPPRADGVVCGAPVHSPPACPPATASTG